VTAIPVWAAGIPRAATFFEISFLNEFSLKVRKK
jgi:hypothetical protein